MGMTSSQIFDCLAPGLALLFLLGDRYVDAVSCSEVSLLSHHLAP